MKSRTLRLAWGGLLLLTALAIGWEIPARAIREVTDGNFNPSEFFFLFTYHANTLACTVFTLSALHYLKKGGLSFWTRSRTWNTIRIAMTLYVVIVPPVFWGLVAAPSDWAGENAWFNFVLHFLSGAVALVAFFVDIPHIARYQRWQTTSACLIYPTAFVIISLVKGSATGWYPYPFLDPDTSGWGFVGAMIGVLLITFSLLAATATWFAVWHTARPPQHSHTKRAA